MTCRIVVSSVLPLIVAAAGAVAGQRVFPGVAAIDGVNGTRWRSELVCHDPYPQPVTLELTIVPRGAVAPSASGRLELAAGETVWVPDIYARLTAPDGAGALSVEGLGVCWVRTANLAGDATFGQQIPSVATDPGGASASPSSARLLPVFAAADVATEPRTNLVLYSLDSAAIELELAVGGEVLGHLTLPPGEMLQRNDLGAWLGLPTGIAVVAISGDGAWASYVSVVDPYSGDPTTFGFEVAVPLGDAPQILTQPADAEVAAGDTVTLSVVASGAQPLTYRWYRGASGDTNEPMAAGTSASFTTPPVTAATSYWVEVSNAIGREASRAARLTVRGQVATPTMAPLPGAYTAPVEVRLSCAIAGATIHYTLDGSPPTVDSPQYVGPILIANHATGDHDPDPLDAYEPLTTLSAQLRAVAVADGMVASGEAAGDYLVDLIETSFNVPYAAPPAAGGTKHLLDVYRPRGATAAPVVVFIHGGAWKQGDKNIYLELGNVLAGYWGIVTVIANYELSADPWYAVHPDHVEDVARAVRWTFDNLATIGGDPERVFLFGQSAGGHLVSLAALDGRYLSAEGLSPDDLAGVVTMSGAYDLADLVAWPVNPLGLDAADVLTFKTLMLNTFGSWEADVLGPASPATWISAAQPPMRVIAAWEDMPGFQQEAIDFHAAIAAVGGPEVDLVILAEEDIPPEVLALDLGGHYEEIYAINTRDHASVSSRAVAEWVLSH